MRAFSIGYKIKDNEFLEEETSDGRDYANIIKDLELFEISVVSVPMNAYSLMKSIGDCFELKEVAGEEHKKADSEEPETAEDQEEKSADEDKEAESDKDEEEKEKKADTDEESDEEEEQDPPADEDDSEDDEDEEDKKSLAPEDKKADEQSDIEEPEKSDQPENPAETAEDGKKSIGSAEKLKDLQIKSVENFISSEMKSIEKKFTDQLAEKDERIGKLEEKLKNALELLGDTITVLGQINKAVENTVVKT